MDKPSTSNQPRPEGEPKITSGTPGGTWPVNTPGGRLHAVWDDQAPVIREGQLIFFFQFLQAGGRWEDFLSRCPLHYTGNRGSGADHIMGTVSEDAVRLGMRRIEQKAGLDWISMQILGCILPVFGVPWILDIDVTVKPRYGRQEVAVVGHPSHVDHSYFVANLRISLGVEVRPGIALDG